MYEYIDMYVYTYIHIYIHTYVYIKKNNKFKKKSYLNDDVKSHHLTNLMIFLILFQRIQHVMK